MVASSVEVISKKAGTDQAFRWSSEGKSSYSIDPAERAEQGSTIILHLNEEGEEYASRYRLDSLIKKYSDHVAYPIYLEYDQESYTDEKDSEGNPIKKSEHKREQINSASALWTRSKSSIKDEEYKEFYKNNYFDQEDPLFYIHTHAEGATEYTTLFFIPAKAPFDMNYADYRSGVKLYVKRVYITDDDKELLPTYLRFVRGVIDSEDLPLNVSREILQENRIMSTIRNGSVKKLLGEFKKLSENNPELYDKFIKEYNRPLKEGLYSDYANRDTLLELVRYKSDSVEGFTSLKAYKERMKEDQKAIYYITGGKENILRNSPLLSAYKKKGYEVLIMDDDIDEIVISMVGEYQNLPLKAINKSGALDDIKEEKSEDVKKSEEGIVKRFKDLLGDSVKDVIASNRLTDTPAVIVMDENDPSWQMQKLMKQMGNMDDMPEVKPIFEINTNSELVKKAEVLSDEDAKMLANVLLDGAYLAEGIMPKDPSTYTKNVATLLAK